jgi:enamidase
LAASTCPIEYSHAQERDSPAALEDRMSLLPAVLALATFVVSLPVTAQEPTLVIENGRVVVGNGTVYERASVVISGERIVEVTTRAVQAPNARRLDARGLTVLPGLIDAHVHLSIRQAVTDTASLQTYLQQDVPAVLDAFLRSGITTLRSAGDYWPWIGQLRDRIRAGEVRGPRLVVGGPVLTLQDAHPATTICARNAFCRAHVVAEVRTADDARAIVQRLAREGVDFIKVVSDSTIVPVQMPDDVLAAIVAEAHRNGLDVVAHMADAGRMRTAVNAGLDGLAHPPGEPLSPEAAREFAAVLVQQGTPVTTTLAGFPIFVGVPINVAIEQPASPLRQNLARGAQALATMAGAGAQLVVGTDWCACGRGAAQPPLQAGSATVTEMEILRWGELSAESVIAAATINAARALGLGSELGSLEPGKLADLVLVVGNPLQDFAQLRNVRAVLRSGRIVVENQP